MTESPTLPFLDAYNTKHCSPNRCCLGAKGLDASANGKPIGADSKRAEKQKTAAYYISEGIHGCFKERLLCGISYELCHVSLTAGRQHHNQIAVAAAGAAESQQVGKWREEVGFTAAAERTGNAVIAEENREKGGARENEDEDEDAVVMGPSGLPGDLVAHKRLPKFLKPGDWLYFSRMGAYTTSIATITSSEVLETCYCYVASTPDVGSDALSGDGQTGG